MKYDIFLSYSHRDAEIASGIYTQLDNAGYICFMAEKEIKPAQEWSSTIHDAISNSKLLFILITPRSKDSLWVAAEAGAAWALKKKVIPALMFVDTNDLIQIINKWQSYTVETPTQIDKLISELPKYNIIKSKENNNSPKKQKDSNYLLSENFKHKEIWGNLIKIGRWSIDPKEKIISGKGSYNFLLSSNEYGKKDFSIHAELLFKEHEHSVLGMNAGIVLGWSNEGTDSNYHNLLFTGKKLLLEETGKNSYFRHLDSGVDFSLEMNKLYKINVSFHKNILKVNIDGRSLYSVYVESDISGNVGLRPWRSEIQCLSFEVAETK